ncbi:MAG: motility associated factor glycosyltransferase family protein [Nitrospinaceae bacterium]|nr:motility associated factor glycosyltransferase family protein [Nitrospinaceae bacterium]
MSDSLANKNLTLLKRLHPSLYTIIAPAKVSLSYEPIISKSGALSLSHRDSMGVKKQVYSLYDPIAEASRHLESLEIEKFTNFIVLGFGLGHQVTELIKKTSSRSNIYIFEKDPELIALAIREIDLSNILNHSRVKLFVDVKTHSLVSLLETIQTDFSLNEYRVISQKSLVDFNREYYGSLKTEIEAIFKKSEINLKTQVIHSKQYCKNIFSNLTRFLDSPGIIQLKEGLPDIPVVICSAGPSLDKNIQLLKSSRNKFFLAAVGTALKPLLRNGIRPDVVFSIDPDALTINCFDLSKDIDDYWLIFNSSVPELIPQLFPKCRLAFDSEYYLAKWFKKYSEDKGGLGDIFSVAHAAVRFAQFLACSPIITIGQDLSFNRQQLHARNTFYCDGLMDKVCKLKPYSYWEDKKFKVFGENLSPSQNLYGVNTVSTHAMESYNDMFAKSFNNSQSVINATEGGVPIKGVQNLTLREAIYSYCHEPVTQQIDSLFERVEQKKECFQSLDLATSEQVNQLQDIAATLNILKDKYLEPGKTTSQEKHAFIDEMRNLYQIILINSETALIIQGYEFAGFSNWYRSNNKILGDKERSLDSDLLEEEFKRDHDFLVLLIDAVDELMIRFKEIIPA